MYCTNNLEMTVVLARYRVLDYELRGRLDAKDYSFHFGYFETRKVARKLLAYPRPLYILLSFPQFLLLEKGFFRSLHVTLTPERHARLGGETPTDSSI